MKRLANSVTVSRIIFAAVMPFAAFLSPLFWVCYICAGLSDILDGFIARKSNQSSESGARLDSIADLCFSASIGAIVIIQVALPLWLWICLSVIMALRLIGYAIGFCKYHAFSGLHTYMNKAAGLLIFAFPLFYTLFGMPVTGIILSAVALFSAAEELLITSKSNTLNRNCRSLFKK